jgi:hypothetical protein
MFLLPCHDSDSAGARARDIAGSSLHSWEVYFTLSPEWVAVLPGEHCYSCKTAMKKQKNEKNVQTLNRHISGSRRAREDLITVLECP